MSPFHTPKTGHTVTEGKPQGVLVRAWVTVPGSLQPGTEPGWGQGGSMVVAGRSGGKCRKTGLTELRASRSRGSTIAGPNHHHLPGLQSQRPGLHRAASFCYPGSDCTRRGKSQCVLSPTLPQAWRCSWNMLPKLLLSERKEKGAAVCRSR